MTQQARQPLAFGREDGHSVEHVEARPRNLRGWRTVRELVEELRFPSTDACRVWLRRQGIANVRRGRIILVSGVDVDRALRGR